MTERIIDILDKAIAAGYIRPTDLCLIKNQIGQQTFCDRIYKLTYDLLTLESLEARNALYYSQDTLGIVAIVITIK